MLALRIMEASVRMSEGNCSERLQEGPTNETVASASPGVERAEGAPGSSALCRCSSRSGRANRATTAGRDDLRATPAPATGLRRGEAARGPAPYRLASSEGEGRRTRSGHDKPRRVRGSRRAGPTHRGGIARCRSGQLRRSPRCGFFSMVEGNVLTRAQQADKPRLVVEVADEVWGGPRLTQRATACPSRNVMRIGRLCTRSEVRYAIVSGVR